MPQMLRHLVSFAVSVRAISADPVRRAMANGNTAWLDLPSRPPQFFFECRQCSVAHMMLDPLGIAFRGLLVDPEAEEKRDDDPVTSSTRLGKLLSRFGEEYRAVGFPPDKAGSLETRDILGDSGRLHAKALRDIDRAGLSPRLDQFRDQLDVILRHLAFVRLTHGCEPLRLRFRRSVRGFRRFTSL